MSNGQDTTAYDLKLLSIGYYIQGGIAAFYSVIILCYFLFFGAVFSQVAETAAKEKGQPVPPALAPILFAIFAFIALAAFVYAFCTLLSGYWLRRYQHRTFIQITAAFNCLGIPYGTALGICTFIVLQRPTARQLFSPAPPAYGEPQALPPV